MINATAARCGGDETMNRLALVGLDRDRVPIQIIASGQAAFLPRIDAIIACRAGGNIH